MEAGSELIQAADRPAVAGGGRGGLLRRAFERWKKAAHAIGVVQTRIIMFAIYLVCVVPMGLLFRLLRDPLRLQPPADTNWTPCRGEPHTLETAHRQF